MALIGNRSILHKSPGRFLSGTAGTLRSGFNKPGMLAGRFETMDALSAALPGGHLSPSAWSLPRTAGGMSTVNQITGAASVIASGALGVNGEAALAGSGGISTALLALVLSAVASLSGSGGLTADIVGKLEAAADLSGAGDLDGAAGALASMLADLSGAGALAAVPRADATMSANIRGYGDLTPEGIRDMILALGATGGLTTDQSDMLRRIFELHGLDPAKPLVVGPTSRVAGDISQTVSEAAGVTTVTRV